MIPPNKQQAVQKALHTAFGVKEYDSILQLTKGLSSALIFKIIVLGKPYLLRIITRTDAMADPTYYYACMEAGAEAELAPPVYYLSSEDRVSITGFINEQSFPIPVAKEKMALLLQKLHALPKFPFRINFFDAMEGFIAKYQAANILPVSVTKGLFELYEQVISIYPRNDQEHWVSCHNDLKPENIIYDGQRPWLVDWEGAFLNDRYVDLAVVANFVVRNEADKDAYLKTYFGKPADEYQHARLLVMSQILHVYYFIMFMWVGTSGKPVSPEHIPKPGFRYFHVHIWNGKVNLADNDVKLMYAQVHMQQLLKNGYTKRFKDALHIVKWYS